MTQISPREALTVARIVRVNHAGEHGAIRIYSAQIAISTRLYPDIAALLAEMLEHEQRHCRLFLQAMPARHSRPCRIMSLWSWGGALLGFITALSGRQAIWICTAAVEAAVHRHLDDQLHFLTGRDDALSAIIMSIREEELAHLHHAVARIVTTSFASRSLHRIVTWATDTVIRLSTWGDSTRMAKELRASLATQRTAAGDRSPPVSRFAD